MPGPAGLSFSHVGLYVCELAPMEAFYTGVLGFTVTDRGELPGPEGKPIGLVFLSRDPDEHHQIVLATGRPRDLAFNVVNQISLRAESLATLQVVHRALVSHGAKQIAPITHGNALSVYAHDPEGNRIEVFWNTPWYVTQPVRVPVDLTQPEESLLNWVEAHARSLPGFRPRAEWRAEMARKMGLA